MSLDNLIEARNLKEREALELTQKIQLKAPAYSVKWNGKSFEVWAHDYVHYRRDSCQAIIDLIES